MNNYLGIDIGGTKTLICKLSEDGQIISRERFETPQDYQEFLKLLGEGIHKTDLGDVVGIAVGAPGELDREQGLVLRLGNLPWQAVPLEADIQKLCGKPVAIENDAKLAGLYESHVVGAAGKRVFYVTISTGIGIALTVNGTIDTTIADSGGKNMVFEHKEQLVPWESFASGKALFNEYGKRASDQDDPMVWQEFCRRLVPGFTQIITLTSPDVITIGGGVGAHYDKFEHMFEPLLESYLSPRSRKPEIVQATNAEDAVIYGCHAYAKQKFGQ